MTVTIGNLGQQVKRIEYYPNGQVKQIEYYEPVQAAPVWQLPNQPTWVNPQPYQWDPLNPYKITCTSGTSVSTIPTGTITVS